MGALGPAARRFIDFLRASGQRYWQVLPLGPTGFGDSPYACLSSFAGNPLLISFEQLVADGYLAADDAADVPDDDPTRIDYGSVINAKLAVLQRAWERFCESPPDGVATHFERFCQNESAWLDDYALYVALKAENGGRPWHEWDAPLRDRAADAMLQARTALAGRMDAVRFQQFLFFEQWHGVRYYANQQGVKVIGDLPIYVPHDSVDVWADQSLFELDEQGMPMVVAGVPPDYFSATGQLWGNPIYRWAAHAESGYQWWVARMRAQLRLVDVLRLDHFRGFAAYWAVPGDAETAIDGHWCDGPGKALFDAVAAALGAVDGLPLIAEDLGLITDDVVALRHALGLPGMAVLQFAFDSDAHNLHLPHRHGTDQVVYTGTHDNDTTVGWYDAAPGPVRAFADAYLGEEGHPIHHRLIRQALASVADMAIIPMQDVLGLGSEARMNRPGQAVDNWSWRLTTQQLEAAPSAWLYEQARLFGRG